MWILVEVDDSSDVGVSERRRFLMRKRIALKREIDYSNFAYEYHVDEYMTEVHPATKEVK